MSLLTVKQLKYMPEMVVPGVAGTLVEVKPARNVNGAKGPTTAQDFKIQDGNDWMFGTAWGMPDIMGFRGTDVIFVSNKAGNNKLAGVSIKEKKSQDGSKTYKNIYVTAAGTLHTKETYEQNRGASPAPQPAAPFVAKPPVQQQSYPNPVMPPQSSAIQNIQVGSYVPLPPPTARQPQTSIQGVTVGMAINNAIHILIATKAFPEGGFSDEMGGNAIHRVASVIIKVSQRLERGDLGLVSSTDNAVVSFEGTDSVVTRVMNSPLSGSVGNPPAAGYTQADTAGIERFEDAIPKPRPKPTPGPGGSAFPDNQGNIDEDVPF